MADNGENEVLVEKGLVDFIEVHQVGVLRSTPQINHAIRAVFETVVTILTSFLQEVARLASDLALFYGPHFVPLGAPKAPCVLVIGAFDEDTGRLWVPFWPLFTHLQSWVQIAISKSEH